MAKQPMRNKSGKFKTQKTRNSKDRRAPSGGVNARNGIKKRLSTNRPLDARQKILQKKRKTVTDAREILTKKAESQDARSRLNNIRDRPSGSYSSSPSVKAIGSNIIRKTDRNGKISLVTNKTKFKNDINTAIQKQLGLLPASKSRLSRSPKRSPPSQHLRNPTGVRKTILNEMDYHLAPVETVRVYDPAVYKWTRPELRSSAASDIINLETTRQVMRETLREELSNGWPTFASHKPRVHLRPQPRVDSRAYIDLVDEDEEMPIVTSVSRPRPYSSSMRVSNIRSRLDSSPSYPQSHGILSKPKVLVPAGHRIVVSNLQTTVTQDDIKELFEDIGELISAKLVRPGVAEVIYKNLRDAQKAVDTYHNRQLDGQPMKCLLVNKRPLHQPTAPPLKTESLLVSRNLSMIPPCSPSDKLTPDISTIHKVLFQKK